MSLSGVGKRYPGAVEAVRDLTLDVADGELMVLVGPSGSGKSTVLRLVAGLESLTDGRITIGDRVADTLHPKDRDVAMVFQDYALYPHMTVAENIGFSLRVRRVPRDEVRRRVERAAAMLGLDGLLDRKPHALSGGQQQRVALGRAIVREPAAFLFDEPLSNLDAALRVSTRAEIKSLQKRLGTTALYVTHDQEEAMTLADRLAVLAEGRLQQLGTPLEVYRRPANRFVASFIGSPPMCFVDGTLDGSGEFAEAVDGGGGGGLRIALPAGGLGGRDVVLGVRPHALTEDGDGPRVDLTVDHVETLGATMDVIGTTAGGARLVARLPAREGRAEAGRLALALDTSQTCLFEPGAYGRSLWPAG